jgi:hypothetical protein
VIYFRRFLNPSTLVTNGFGASAGVTATPPGAPTSVTAVGGDASARVSFTAPTVNGGSSITGYTVTSIPAGGTDIHATTASGTHTITGLTNGQSYTFTVIAINAIGTSVASAASNAVTPQAVAVAPTIWVPVSTAATAWTPVS